MHVASLHRFPVKGLAGEPLDTVELSAGAGVPHDRRFAVLRGDIAYDPASTRWVAKEKCVMLARGHALARLRLRRARRRGEERRAADRRGGRGVSIRKGP